MFINLLGHSWITAGKIKPQPIAITEVAVIVLLYRRSLPTEVKVSVIAATPNDNQGKPYSHSIIELWLFLYHVFFDIWFILYIPILYVLYCFTDSFDIILTSVSSHMYSFLPT